MNSLSLRARLMSGFAAMAAAVFVLAGYMLFQEERIRAEVQHLADVQADVQNRMQDLREQLNAMQRNAFQGGLNRDRALLLFAAGEAARLFEVFDELRASPMAADKNSRLELIDFLDRTETLYRETTARAFEILGELAEGGDPEKERMSQLRLDNIRLNSAFDAYLSKVRGENAVRLQEFIDRMEELRSFSLGIVGASLLAMAAFLYLLNAHLTRPLRQLNAFVEGLANPMALGQRLAPKRLDEIGKVAHAIDAMLDRLRETAISREHFDRILTSLSNGIVVVSPDLRIASLNGAAAAMFGVAPDDAIEREIDALLPAAICHGLRAGEKVDDLPIELTAPDGGRTPATAYTKHIAGRNEWLVVITDVSAQQESERRYRQVIENVSEGILVVQKGRIVFGNPPVERLIGVPLPEIRQQLFTEYVHPDDRALVIDRHQRRLRGETIEPHYSFRVVNRSGETIWVDLSAVMIEWEGAPATLSFITDITERHRLEASLKESLAQRETILENSVVGIAFLNAKGRVQWVNQAMANIFGAQKGDYHGESLERFYPSREVYLATGEAVARAVVAGRAYEAELQMRRIDGRMFWVYLSGKAIDQSNLSKGTVWVVMDITRRRELEEALKRTSSELEAILQSALVGITHSINRIHVWGNRKFAQMLGFDQQELIGKSSEIHYPDHESWKALGDRAYPVLARGEPFVTDWPMKRKDGSILWCQLYGNNVDPNDPAKGAIWSFLDITERKQAELDIQKALEQQRELNELKSRFVSMTSHEFRTPLATILSSAELLRYYGDRLPAEEKSDIVLSIESAVKRMTGMLDNILLIGRADAGRLEFRPSPLSVDEFAHALAEETAAAVDGTRGAAARLEFVSSLPPGARAALDEKLLRHILGNLLSNAYKYSPAGGVVRLEIDRVEDKLRFAVSDQGIGIPEEDLPKLFETFHRAGNVGNISGTGLGMAIVKRATELHGGTITVRSKVGEGSCFVVELPWRAGD